jgi:hypothetical protein
MGRKGGNPNFCRCGSLAGKDSYCKTCRPKAGISSDVPLKRDSFMPEFGGYYGKESFLSDKFGAISDKFGLEK